MQVPGWLGNHEFQLWSPKEYKKKSHTLQTVYFVKYNLPTLELDLFRLSRKSGGESKET